MLNFIISCSDNKNQLMRKIVTTDTIHEKSKNALYQKHDSLVDWTNTIDSICEIHYCKMDRDTVPNVICGDMDIDAIISGRTILWPHGYKFVCINGKTLGVTRAIIFTCSQCIKAYESEHKNKTVDTFENFSD
jgi:hypothetical protein